jgi:membrane-associated phospholipid phosphatase
MYFVLFLQHAIISDQFTVYFLKTLPFCYTFYIGAMRITEHRHHFEDVLAGMIIGFLFPVVFFLGQNARLFPPAVRP